MLMLICSILWEPLSMYHIVILNSLSCAWLFPVVEIFECFGESSHFADVRLVNRATFDDFG